MSASAALVIGGGLAGCEAAWQMAQRGISVDLYEMRPKILTPAHQTEWLAELVCSNSFKSDASRTASGLLKRELRLLGSLILDVAQETAVPAGSALAVDRHRFAARVTEILIRHPRIRVVRQEVTALPLDAPLVLASGPLTSPAMSEDIQTVLGIENLFFYDAIAPLIAAESLDRGKSFVASRYGRGTPAYLNCPLDKSEYEAFYQRILVAKMAPLHAFERDHFFESCMPVEELARRGPRTLLFGPMRAVGLVDPRTGRRPYAVVQLRQDDVQATIYNMVGFQTRLRQGEQRAVFQLIPGLERAEFLRYGSMHRNTFICAPRVLEPSLRLFGHEAIFLAGQLTGSEGYMESVATGLLAGLNLSRTLQGRHSVVPPGSSTMGALVRYLAETEADHFQPMNVNFGLLPPLDRPPRNREMRNRQLVSRSLEDMSHWLETEEILSRANRQGNGQEISHLAGLGEKLL